MRRKRLPAFFTKYGDGGTDINPIFRLNKRQGKQLLAHLGCPEHLYKKLPTADLEDDRPPCRMKWPWVSPTRTSTIIWKAKRWTRASPNDRGLVSENRNKRRPPITVFDDFWKNSLPAPGLRRVIFALFAAKMACYTGWIDSVRSYCGQKAISPASRV